VERRSVASLVHSRTRILYGRAQAIKFWRFSKANVDKVGIRACDNAENAIAIRENEVREAGRVV